MIRHRSSRPLPYFVPEAYYNEGVGRHALPHGGPPESGRVRGGRMATEYVGGPDAPNAELEAKLRGPWWHAPTMRPAADPIRWTDSGPIRLDMHMSTYAWRPWAGTFGQYQEGWHTGTPITQKEKLTKGSNKEVQMTRPWQNRLTFARYRGQTYSQTTEMLRMG